MFAFTGAIILLVGELAALRQVGNLARVLVISSIAECGFVLLGLGTGTFVGGSGAVLHLGYQVVMRGLVFVAAWRLIKGAGSSSLEQLKGSGARMPLTATLFGFGLFSVMGLSPFKGSISKFLVIYSAIEGGHWWLAAAGTIASIIGAVYYLRIIQQVCLEKTDGEKRIAGELRAAPVASVLMLALAGLTIFMSLFPEPFLHWSEKAAALWLPSVMHTGVPEFESPWSLLVLVPYVGGFAVYLLGRFSHGLRNGAAIALAALALALAWQADGIDSLSRLFAVIMAAVGLLVVLYSAAYMKGKAHSNRYFFFLLLMLGSLLGLTTSPELGNFYVFWELMTWTSYFLVIHEQTQKALRAGYKYFLMCTSGAYVMHFGILTLHAELGSLDLSVIADKAPLLSPALMAAVLVTFMVGLGVKTGLVPLHSWLPDAHPVAPSSISAPMSGILTKAGVYGLTKILFAVFGVGLLARLGSCGSFSTFGLALSVLGSLTLLYGEVMALRQTDIKRMLAYSTMAQVGEIVAVLGLGTYLSIAGSLLHVLNHAIMKNLLFLAVGALIFRLKRQDIDSFKGVGRVMPVTSACFSIGVLAIMGLPPFNGFISKFLMLYASVQAGQVALAALILFGSVLGGIYYLRLVRILFFEKYQGPALKEVPASMLAPILALTGLCIFNGLFPQFSLGLVRPVADLIAARGGMALTAIPDLSIAWPLMVVIPMLGGLLVYLVGKRSAAVSGWLAVATMVATMVAVFAASDALDIFSWSFALLIAFIGVLNLLYSLGYMSHGHAQGRFYMFFVLMIGGLLGVAVSKDLFNFFVFWEIMSSWTLYFVIIHEETREALREGFKYFLFNYIGASLMFLGLLVLAANAGTFAMAELAGRLSALPTGLLALGLILMLLGFMMKGAMLPFRIDYQMHPPTAPTPVSGYISSVLLKSAPFGMAKLFYVFGGVALIGNIGMAGGMSGLMYVAACVGGLTTLMAAALALVQSGMKRLLIYHTVSQMGYIILGVSLGTSLGVAGGLLHLVNHMLFKNLLFLVAGAIMVKAGVENLDQLGGIGRKMPITLAVFAIGAFSIAGVPPLNGFTSKWLIYQAAMEGGHVFLALLAMAASVLTLASFVKFLHAAFFGQLSRELEHVTEAPATMLTPMVLLAFLCILFGIFPGLLLTPIASIETALGLVPLDVSLFGRLLAPGGWNPGLMTLLAVVVLLCAKGFYALGNGRVRYTKAHTCGVTDLEPGLSHVNASNLYESPKALVLKCIRLVAWKAHSDRER
ncbi:proton-conducting transporter transmembrane domain-containing protein [Geothermobacter ehrlichii]|uniref:proton-conducting transporter transmembrane domain-containing protein n=1 Tax=Geothermobacter ehrlichii TaxID=213224 RepID=UPI001CA36E9A|nr:proton-conducting transporter membrane subunit [Geothermobacter ehrlichii]